MAATPLTVTLSNGFFYELAGTGTPEAAQTAPVGSRYTDRATGTLYVKATGTGNTGWVAMAAGLTANLVQTTAAPGPATDGFAPIYNDALTSYELLEAVEVPVPIADGGTGATSAFAALANLSGQPLDSDLTAIALLATASFGRSLLTLVDAAALMAALGTNPLARANHTGTQLAATVSDLAAVVQAYRLDQFAAPTATVSMGSQRVTSVAEPTQAADAVTKAYADALASGQLTKEAVRAATTANITLSGAQTIDGVSVVAGDRVLVKNQSTGSQNGIYVAASGAWARSTDADVDAEVDAGMYTFATSGTVNAGKGFQLITANPITVGTTALVFTQTTGTADPTVGGDLTGTAANAQIAAGAIVNADISATAAIVNTKLATNPLARANHTGTQLAATVSDLSTAVRAVTPVRNPQTAAAYTLVLSDAGGIVERNSASANTLTIPTNAAVAIPIDSVIVVYQHGAGTTTIDGAGVTLLSRGGALVMAGQYAWVTLYKRATNEWVISGDLVP